MLVVSPLLLAKLSYLGSVLVADAAVEDAAGLMKPYSKKWLSMMIKFLNS